MAETRLIIGPDGLSRSGEIVRHGKWCLPQLLGPGDPFAQKFRYSEYRK
jgi:hypothetical protein